MTMCAARSMLCALTAKLRQIEAGRQTLAAAERTQRDDGATNRGRHLHAALSQCDAATGERMSNFLQEIESSLPRGVTLPDPFKAMFAWMDQNGYVHRDRSGGRYAWLYPFTEDPEGSQLSLISFAAVDLAPGWTGHDPLARARLAPFIRTGGDGSWAAIWLDDQGRQQFVHLGSGSGSTMLCTLTDNRSEEHTSELQSLRHLVCRLLLEKTKN